MKGLDSFAIDLKQCLLIYEAESQVEQVISKDESDRS